jgi:hypothetical protein
MRVFEPQTRAKLHEVIVKRQTRIWDEISNIDGANLILVIVKCAPGTDVVDAASSLPVALTRPRPLIKAVFHATNTFNLGR